MAKTPVTDWQSAAATVVNVGPCRPQAAKRCALRRARSETEPVSQPRPENDIRAPARRRHCGPSLVESIAQSATHDLLIERHAKATTGVLRRRRCEVWGIGQADMQILQLGRPVAVKRHLDAGAHRPTT